jgi:hypothetical protein
MQTAVALLLQASVMQSSAWCMHCTKLCRDAAGHCRCVCVHMCVCARVCVYVDFLGGAGNILMPSIGDSGKEVSCEMLIANLGPCNHANNILAFYVFVKHCALYPGKNDASAAYLKSSVLPPPCPIQIPGHLTTHVTRPCLPSLMTPRQSDVTEVHALVSTALQRLCPAPTCLLCPVTPAPTHEVHHAMPSHFCPDLLRSPCCGSSVFSIVFLLVKLQGYKRRIPLITVISNLNST